MLRTPAQASAVSKQMARREKLVIWPVEEVQEAAILL